MRLIVIRDDEFERLKSTRATLFEGAGVRLSVTFTSLFIESPYNSGFVSGVKRLDCRSWTGSANAIKLVCDDSVREALELVKEYYDVDFDVEELFNRIYSTVPRWNLLIFINKEGQVCFERPFKFDNSALYKIAGRFGLSRGNGMYCAGDDVTAFKFFTAVIKYIKKERSHWDVLITESALRRIQEVGKRLWAEKIEKRKRLERMIQLSQQTAPPEPVRISLPKGFKLYNFQRHAVWWLEKVARGAGLIADEMGLGKTIEALAWLRIHRELRPVLIVCPASVKLNWAKEVEKWLGEHVQILRGRNAMIGKANVYIINYDIVSSNLEQLIALKPAVLILDEAHYIKNIKAKRTQAVLKLAEGVHHVIALTGTPILNSAIELYPILVALKKLENSKRAYWKFAEKFAYIEEVYIKRRMQTVKVIKGVKNPEKLNVLLRGQGIMLRRTKEQVFSQLPSKRRILVRLEVDERKYRKELVALAKWIQSIQDRLEEEFDNILVRIERLRQLAVALKLTEAIDFIKNTVIQEKKVVVFAHHRKVIEVLTQELQKLSEELRNDGQELKVLQIVGGMSSDQKQAVVEEFNRSKNAVVIVSIRAGGEGVNLQSASVGIFLELDWTPARILQAEDRLHRIGQKRQVDYYYLIAQDTIEESMYDTLVEKLETITEVTEMKKLTFKVIREELARTGLDLQKLLEERRRQKVKASTKRRASRRRKK